MEQTVTVPLRICKTCGLEKSLDHFVSLYTDTITNNCDFCRSRQRQQYKEMQLRKRLAKRGLLHKQGKNGLPLSLSVMNPQPVSLPTALHESSSSEFSSSTTSISLSPGASNPNSSPINTGVPTTSVCFTVPRSTWIPSSTDDLLAVFKARLVRYGVDSVY